jgi:hypothetical protein
MKITVVKERQKKIGTRANREPMSNAENISQENKEVIRNLYLSGIGEEFIAMQLDLEIPVVIRVLKELGEYKT